VFELLAKLNLERVHPVFGESRQTTTVSDNRFREEVIAILFVRSFPVIVIAHTASSVEEGVIGEEERLLLNSC